MKELQIRRENYKNLPKLAGFYADSGIKELVLHFNPSSPDIGSVKKYLMMSLEHEARSRIRLLDIPFCLVPNAEDHVTNPESGQKTKVPACSRCIFDGRCGGLWKNHINTYKTLLEPIMDKPEEIVLELTSKCNLACPFCFNKTIYQDNENFNMDISLAKDVIDQAKALKIKHVRFSGGEPLLHPGLMELIRYAHEKSLGVRLNTNGTLIDKSFVSQAKDLVDNVLIGLNSRETETEKIAALRLLKSSKIPIVRVGTMATMSMVKELDKLFDIIQKIGIRYWEFYRPVLLSKEQQDLDQASIGLLAEKIMEYYKNNGLLFQVANALPFCSHDPNKINFISVGARYDDGHSRLVVDPRGYVRPSYFIDENLGSASDISSCWNHSFMKGIRDLKLMPKECKGCFYRYKCKGGSRYFARLFNGSYNAKDPLAVPERTMG